MALSITLQDDLPGRPLLTTIERSRCLPVETHLGPAYVEWDDPRAPALLLYPAEEPEVGARFRYEGVDWEVVDYRDGWVARLVVE